MPDGQHLNGGITPYLDREGASVPSRSSGDTFHHPPSPASRRDRAGPSPPERHDRHPATTGLGHRLPDHRAAGRRLLPGVRRHPGRRPRDLGTRTRVSSTRRRRGWRPRGTPRTTPWTWSTALVSSTCSPTASTHPLLSTVSPLAAGLVNMEISRGDGSLGTVIAVQAGLALRTLGAARQPRAAGEVAAARSPAPRCSAPSPSPNRTTDRTRSPWRPAPAATGTGGSCAAPRNGSATAPPAASPSSGPGLMTPAPTTTAAVRCFLVPQDTPGYRGEVITRKASLRAIHQATITLDDVHLPADAVLPGARTFKDAATGALATRAGVAWSALGPRHRLLRGRPRLRPAARPVRQAARRVPDWSRNGSPRCWPSSPRCSSIAAASPTSTPPAQLAPTQASLAKYHNTRAARRVAAIARDLLGGNGILLGLRCRAAHGRHRIHPHLRRHRIHPGPAHRPRHHRPSAPSPDPMAQREKSDSARVTRPRSIADHYGDLLGFLVEG